MTRGRRSRHLGRIALLCVLALVMTGVSTAGFAYLRIVGNVKETDVRKYLKNRPTLPKGKAGKALNILILGSDIRTGKSDVDGAGASGDVDGMRADTTMIMHISADRKRVYFVSIPRDTVVDIPSSSSSQRTRRRRRTPSRSRRRSSTRPSPSEARKATSPRPPLAR